MTIFINNLLRGGKNEALKKCPNYPFADIGTFKVSLYDKFMKMLGLVPQPNENCGLLFHKGVNSLCVEHGLFHGYQWCNLYISEKGKEGKF